MFTLLAYFGCFVTGVLGHAYAYPVLTKLWSSAVAFFKKEKQKIEPTVPSPTVTPTVSG